MLLGDLLQWANENKRQSFDFMRGDEDYKYRFGGVNRYIVRAMIQRPISRPAGLAHSNSPQPGRRPNARGNLSALRAGALRGQLVAPDRVAVALD